MDTVCTVTADCNTESLNGALDLCENLDRLLSRHRPESEVSLLNHYDELEISKDTLTILSQAIYYCQKTGGKYDITITPASNLYDFSEQKAPTEEEAKKVLYKVGYNRIEIKGNYVDLHNTDIDFGSIAKISKDSVVRGTLSIAKYDGNWYWKSEVIDESREKDGTWPEYVQPLPESLNEKIKAEEW